MTDSRYALGLALGGGAGRGLYHLGVLKALGEAGIVPDAVSGTSAGAVVAAMWSAGLPFDQMAGLARSVRWTRDLFDMKRTLRKMGQSLVSMFVRPRRPLPPGPIDNSGIAATINSMVGQRRMSEARPCVLVGTDIVTGEKLLFTSPALAPLLAARRPLAPVPDDGVEDDPWEDAYRPREVVVPWEDIGLAAQASSCFPGVFTSLELACPDLEGKTTVRMVNDGGLCEQVPVGPLKALGCRRVVAVLLGFMPQYRVVRDIVAVNMNCVQIMIKHQITRSLKRADFVIYDPTIEETSLVRLDPRLIDRGYEHTMALMPALTRLLAPAPPAAEPVVTEACQVSP